MNLPCWRGFLYSCVHTRSHYVPQPGWELGALLLPLHLSTGAEIKIAGCVVAAFGLPGICKQVYTCIHALQG